MVGFEGLDTIIAVALFLGGMFWSDYSKRGDRQSRQSSDMAAFESRLKAVETAQADHGEVASAVTRMQVELAGFAREITNMREDFRRVLDEFTRGRFNTRANDVR